MRSEPYFSSFFGRFYSIFFYILVISKWFSFILTSKNQQTDANFQYCSGTGLLDSYLPMNIAV